MFIVWNNMKHLDDAVVKMKRREHRRINFKNMLIGLLFGLIFLLWSIGIMIAYSELEHKEYYTTAALLFSSTDIAQMQRKMKTKKAKYK
uniref:Uncharacterized protein n=1 Tax=Acrobeloides nanus TaxID=290746 RepID=A0A914DWI8_9BILA